MKKQAFFIKSKATYNKISIKIGDMRVDFYTLRLREFGHLCTNSARAHEGAKAEQKQVFLFESEAIMGSPRNTVSWGIMGSPKMLAFLGQLLQFKRAGV